jgi:nucleoside-diphosphate kinase
MVDMRERTLVLIKPDGVRRRLIGKIVGRFEARGLDIIAMKMLQFDTEMTRAHYGQYADQDFYPALSRFIESGPTVAMIVEGNDAIALVRQMMGATSHLEAAPGTIRGDLADDTTINLVHGSDSSEKAAREIARFFREGEILAPPPGAE